MVTGPRGSEQRVKNVPYNNYKEGKSEKERGGGGVREKLNTVCEDLSSHVSVCGFAVTLQT